MDFCFISSIIHIICISFGSATYTFKRNRIQIVAHGKYQFISLLLMSYDFHSWFYWDTSNCFYVMSRCFHIDLSPKVQVCKCFPTYRKTIRKDNGCLQVLASVFIGHKIEPKRIGFARKLFVFQVYVHN